MAEPTKYTQKLAGQRVLVIGATSGIGYGVAEALAEHGSTVIVSSSSAARVSSTVAKLAAAYPSARERVAGAACDLAGPDAEASVAELFRQATDGGRQLLDHVVFTAGPHLATRPFESMSLADMREAGQVRFFGPLLVAQQLRTHLKPGPASSFIITSGTVAERPIPNWAVINSFATGNLGMTRGLALDLAPIRVNCVLPGAVDTPLWEPFKKDGSLDHINFKSGTTTGAMGQVEDVVEAYLYLLKDKNVSGSIIRTDSGALLKS